MTANNTLEARKIVAKNLSNLLNRSGITQTELARRLKLPEASVRSWVNTKKYPRIKNIQKLADYFGVHISDILENRSKISIPNQAFNVPILGKINITQNGVVKKSYEGFSAVLNANIDRNYTYFWLKVSGNSMIGDGILDGDWALIAQTTRYNNDICAVIVGSEEGTLKHVSKYGTSIVLTASNSAYVPRILINKVCNQIKIVGKLI